MCVQALHSPDCSSGPASVVQRLVDVDFSHDSVGDTRAVGGLPTRLPVCFAETAVSQFVAGRSAVGCDAPWKSQMRVKSREGSSCLDLQRLIVALATLALRQQRLAHSGPPVLAHGVVLAISLPRQQGLRCCVRIAVALAMLISRRAPTRPLQRHDHAPAPAVPHSRSVRRQASCLAAGPPGSR